jgi:hypothetical protein
LEHAAALFEEGFDVLHEFFFIEFVFGGVVGLFD